MGVPVLILGESGSGKSASLRNFSVDAIEFGVSVSCKMLSNPAKPLPSLSTLQTKKVPQILWGPLCPLTTEFAGKRFMFPSSSQTRVNPPADEN